MGSRYGSHGCPYGSRSDSQALATDSLAKSEFFACITARLPRTREIVCLHVFLFPTFTVQWHLSQTAAPHKQVTIDMANRLAFSLLVLAVVQGYALAQFNILPVSVAESVIEEHKQKEKERTEELQKVQEPEESPAVLPLHPKIAAGLKADTNAIERTDDTKGVNPEAIKSGRVKRESTYTRTRVSGVDRSAGRNADIDSFLSELEKDISRTQPQRYNVGGVNAAPSWSYKPQTPSTQRPFWKKWGDSLSSTYTQVKNKAKDFTKGLQA